MSLLSLMIRDLHFWLASAGLPGSDAPCLLIPLFHDGQKINSLRAILMSGTTKMESQPSMTSCIEMSLCVIFQIISTSARSDPSFLCLHLNIAKSSLWGQIQRFLLKYFSQTNNKLQVWKLFTNAFLGHSSMYRSYCDCSIFCRIKEKGAKNWEGEREKKSTVK